MVMIVGTNKRSMLLRAKDLYIYLICTMSHGERSVAFLFRARLIHRLVHTQRIEYSI